MTTLGCVVAGVISTRGDARPRCRGRPLSVLLVGVAETYDLLVQVPAAGAYEFRATAHDGSGFASVWLGSGERRRAPEVPKPNLYHGMGHLGLQQIFSFTPDGVMGMPDGDVTRDSPLLRTENI